MRLLLSLSTVLLFALVSCKKESSTVPLTRKFAPLDGVQMVPSKSGVGSGNMDLVYNKSTKILSYTVRWNSLTGPVVGIGIFGRAARGFVTGNAIQSFTFAPPTAAPLPTQGSYSNTLLVDQVTVKEAELLAGEYYMMVITATNQTGEIRGQIEF
jgi:hypothetical protein